MAPRPAAPLHGEGSPHHESQGDAVLRMAPVPRPRWPRRAPPTRARARRRRRRTATRRATASRAKSALEARTTRGGPEHEPHAERLARAWRWGERPTSWPMPGRARGRPRAPGVTSARRRGRRSARSGRGGADDELRQAPQIGRARSKTGPPCQQRVAEQAEPHDPGEHPDVSPTSGAAAVRAHPAMRCSAPPPMRRTWNSSRLLLPYRASGRTDNLLPVKVTMLLCDAAQVSDGKLYILGGGWSMTGPDPVPSAVALKIDVDWHEAETSHHWELFFEDADGRPVLMETAEGTQPVEVRGEFTVSQPQGIPEGSPIDVALAVNLGPIPLAPGHPVRLAPHHRRRVAARRVPGFHHPPASAAGRRDDRLRPALRALPRGLRPRRHLPATGPARRSPSTTTISSA